VERRAKRPIDGLRHRAGCIAFRARASSIPIKYLAALGARHRARPRRDPLRHARRGGRAAGRNPASSRAKATASTCGAVVVATNTPVNDRVTIHTKQAPYLTYVLAAARAARHGGSALLWGHARSRTTTCASITEPEPHGEILVGGRRGPQDRQAQDGAERFDNLERWTRERYPAAREIPLPLVGPGDGDARLPGFPRTHPGDDNVYVATGDSGMGMTHGTIAGLVITDLIHGAEVPWAQLYDPARITLAATRTFAKETANMAWQYTDWLTAGEAKDAEAIAPGSGAVLRRGTHKVAVYRDPAGERHEMSAVCTHLGCIVAWNPSAHVGLQVPRLALRRHGPGRQRAAVADLKPRRRSSIRPRRIR
jgi:Rieske Fe-S protein